MKLYNKWVFDNRKDRKALINQADKVNINDYEYCEVKEGYQVSRVSFFFKISSHDNPTSQFSIQISSYQAISHPEEYIVKAPQCHISA